MTIHNFPVNKTVTPRKDQEILDNEHKLRRLQKPTRIKTKQKNKMKN